MGPAEQTVDRQGNENDNNQPNGEHRVQHGCEQDEKRSSDSENAVSINVGHIKASKFNQACAGTGRQAWAEG
jgi:hypothetical protein